MWTIVLGTLLTAGRAARRGVNAAGNWLFHRGGYKIALILLGAVLSVILIYSALSARSEREAAQRAAVAATERAQIVTKAREADDRAVIQNDKLKSDINKEEAASRAEADRALAAHPEWRDQPIPADVLNSLRD